MSEDYVSPIVRQRVIRVRVSLLVTSAFLCRNVMIFREFLSGRIHKITILGFLDRAPHPGCVFLRIYRVCEMALLYCYSL